MTGTKSFTVRLSPEDQAVLAALAGIFETDRSETVRRALCLALARNRRPARCGHFVPNRANNVHFAIRMRGDNGYE